MEHSEEEKGVALALLKRLVNERLPRLLEMQTRVDNGESLSEFDIDYLEQAFHDANQNRQRAMQFPEYIEIVERLAQLYSHITSKALENETARKK